MLKCQNGSRACLLIADAWQCLLCLCPKTALAIVVMYRSQRTLQAFCNSAPFFHFLYHGGVLQHCMPSCIQAYASKALIEVSSGSCRQGDTVFPKHTYSKVGESSSLHCKAFASADFHISLLSVVMCGFAVLHQ